MNPYVWPAAGHVTLFTCHWQAGSPLRVSLEGNPSEAERHAVAAALTAWAATGLGVDFEVAVPQRAQLRIVLSDGALARSGGREAAGRTAVDCLLPGGRVEQAHLVRAVLWISRRVGPDWRGHSRAASAEELTGTLLHELGHALGFQGHPRFGGVMALDVEATRRRGARVLGGGAVDPGPLRALYAHPSGHVLAKVRVDAWRTGPVDALLKQPSGVGPFVRVGDRAARIFWRNGRRETGTVVPRLQEVYQDPRSVLTVAEPIQDPEPSEGVP